MNIDDFRLSDEQLLRLSRQSPSTEFGRGLLPRWKERFVDPLPSEFYRGYAIVLWALWKNKPDSPTIRGIERIIDDIHDSRMASNMFVRGTDLDAGAAQAASNAWEAAHSGAEPSQLPGAYESELIYVAGLFGDAQSRERRTPPPGDAAPATRTPESATAQPNPAKVRQTRRYAAAAISGVIGLLTFNLHPTLALILFAAAAFFFFAEQSADQVLDRLLPPAGSPSPPDKPPS